MRNLVHFNEYEVEKTNMLYIYTHGMYHLFYCGKDLHWIVDEQIKPTVKLMDLGAKWRRLTMDETKALGYKEFENEIF